MEQFARWLIFAVILGMFSTVFLASSQGWWHYSFRNPNIVKQFEKENKEYRQMSGISQAGSRTSGFRSSSNRTFRSGARGGRGK
jgi:hypothetical protein